MGSTLEYKKFYQLENTLKINNKDDIYKTKSNDDIYTGKDDI